MWISICKLKSAQIPLFSINYLNSDSESLSHEGGRKSDSFWVFPSPGFMPGFLVLRHFSVICWCWVPCLPSQLGPLKSAACSHWRHTWVWNSWQGLKSWSSESNLPGVPCGWSLWDPAASLKQGQGEGTGSCCWWGTHASLDLPSGVEGIPPCLLTLPSETLSQPFFLQWT